jgi:ribosome-binding protein aMBF1 (putative translation factor)
MKKSKLNRQFDKQFGDFVRKNRVAKGWSQAALADKVDNNFQNISRLERGEITPTLFWCYTLADAFDIDLSHLIREFGFKLKK